MNILLPVSQKKKKKNKGRGLPGIVFVTKFIWMIFSVSGLNLLFQGRIMSFDIADIKMIGLRHHLVLFSSGRRHLLSLMQCPSM